MVNHRFSVAPYIYRSQAKSGTCSFYAYATVYVIKKNKRVTLAIKAIQQHNTLVAIITYLLALIEPLKLKIERLYLDREFFCVPVIRWLQALDIPFEMPVIIRGKHGGTRQLIRGRRGSNAILLGDSKKVRCLRRAQPSLKIIFRYKVILFANKILVRTKIHLDEISQKD
jgi:hypothetical protein